VAVAAAGGELAAGRAPEIALVAVDWTSEFGVSCGHRLGTAVTATAAATATTTHINYTERYS